VGAGSTVALSLGTRGETRKSTASKLLSCMLQLETGTAESERFICYPETELQVPLAAFRAGMIFLGFLGA